MSVCVLQSGRVGGEKFEVEGEKSREELEAGIRGADGWMEGMQAASLLQVS